MQVSIPSIILPSTGDVRFIGSDGISVDLTFVTRGLATFVDLTDAQANDQGGQIVLEDQDDPSEFQPQVILFPYGRLSAALDPADRFTNVGFTDNVITARAAGVIEIGFEQSITVIHQGVGLAGSADGAAGFGISSAPFPTEVNGGVVRSSVVEADIFSSTNVRITATTPEILYEDIPVPPGKYYLGIFSAGNASAQNHNLTVERSRFSAADVALISSLINRELGPTKRITGIGSTENGAGLISGRSAGVLEIGYPQSITVTHRGIGLVGNGSGFGISSVPFPAGTTGGVVGSDVVNADIYSSTNNRITPTTSEIVYSDIPIEPGRYYLGVFSGGGAEAEDHVLTIEKSRLNSADVAIISASAGGGGPIDTTTLEEAITALNDAIASLDTSALEAATTALDDALANLGTGTGGTVDTSALASATMALNDAIANLGTGGTVEAYDDTQLMELVTQVRTELDKVKKVDEAIRHRLIASDAVSDTTIESRVPNTTVETG